MSGISDILQFHKSIHLLFSLKVMLKGKFFNVDCCFSHPVCKSNQLMKHGLCFCFVFHLRLSRISCQKAKGCSFISQNILFRLILNAKEQKRLLSQSYRVFLLEFFFLFYLFICFSLLAMHQCHFESSSVRLIGYIQ